MQKHGLSICSYRFCIAVLPPLHYPKAFLLAKGGGEVKVDPPNHVSEPSLPVLKYPYRGNKWVPEEVKFSKNHLVKVVRPA